MSSYEERLAATERALDGGRSPGSPRHGRAAAFAVGNGRGGRESSSKRGSTRETPAGSDKDTNVVEAGRQRATTVATRRKKGGSTAATAVSATASAPSTQRLQYDDPAAVARAEKRVVVKRVPAERPVRLFSHLPQYERLSSVAADLGLAQRQALHPAVVRVGLQLARQMITGGTARVAAVITALRAVVVDFALDGADALPSGVVRSELERCLNRHVQFLVDCRPMSVAAGNAVRLLKRRLAALPLGLTAEALKRRLVAELDELLTERVELALRTIADAGAQRIRDGDTVLTYGSSHAVECILTYAAREPRRRFRVVVLDARPTYAGKQLAERLAQAQIESCEYAPLNALPHLIGDANLVLLGAEACTSNGAVLAQAGTASVALLAKRERIPVVVACESIKFTERTMIDSIGFNEVGDADDMLGGERIGPSALHPSWRRDHPTLKLLHLAHDLTPTDMVDALITEVGLIPPSAVPAVLTDLHPDGI
ncbi:hypothetical protein CDCA_CDCA16G4122 [Cyanidium caldarium]|uniref:Translation initiation factor eIF2B subunit delta n=1 Tax=Cyanidium caldarium TaxID=2771 RepID=A0AAV9J0I7_CYACA|nr:hypothetical protein CDCA_CDCA16G4122 [Cyanidium caldarium]